MLYSIAHALVDAIEPDLKQPGSRFGRRLKASRKTLHITLDGREMEFKSVDDFSFAIECRTGITATRYHALFERTPKELWDEAQNIKAVEKTLVDILEDALCDGTPCGPAMSGLGLHVFSNDHDWRELVEVLIQLDDRYDGYKRLALIKYMQYLGARQEVIRIIFATKNRGNSSKRHDRQSQDEGSAAMETMLFDMSSTGGSRSEAGRLQRLPQGEAVKLYALPGHAVDIRLAKHAFRLVNDNGWALCASNGERYPLGPKQTMIGRGRENDIRLDAEFGYVSRRHLIAEPIDDHVIMVTDLSSHGTFAPAMQTERTVV